MGWLDWLRGRPRGARPHPTVAERSQLPTPPVQAPPSASAQRTLRLRERPSHLVRLSADGRISVAGESHYQPALARAAEGLTAHGSFDDAIPVDVILVPEPSNRFDHDAVRVDVLLDEGTATVGYIPAAICREYQIALTHDAPAKAVGWCPGRIMGGGQRMYGIYLHLAEHGTVLVQGTEPDNAEFLDPERMVTVTGENEYPAAFEALELTDHPQRRIAELRWGVFSRGRHAGQRVVEVWIEGQTAGRLTAAMTTRYEVLVDHVVAAGRLPTCEALLARSDKGPEVSVMLPKP